MNDLWYGFTRGLILGICLGMVAIIAIFLPNTSGRKGYSCYPNNTCNLTLTCLQADGIDNPGICVTKEIKL